MPSVQVERFYLGCLAHASYLISSEGVAAVIDPQRDVDLYVEAATRAGLKIEHVIETHLHADFVSGHHELAGRTGARIYLGAWRSVIRMQMLSSVWPGVCRNSRRQLPNCSESPSFTAT